MSLGLPVHLVANHVLRASTKAAHVVALVALVIGTFSLLSLQASLPQRILWPGLIAFAVLFAVLWKLNRTTTIFWSAAYLLIGGVCVYWISVIGMSEFPGRPVSDSFILSMPKLALVMVGGAGVRSATAVAWSAGGLLTAGVATMAAVRQTGSIFILDATPIAAFLLFVVLHLGILLSRQPVRAAQPSLHRAARDEQLSAMRYRIELKAAAVMHDTVLNHLAAIANAPNGALGASLRTQMDRDLGTLVGEEWLVDAEAGDDQEQSADWRQSRLSAAIDESRQLGLDVQVSGDVSALTRLGSERAAAVALAAKQCLVNVLRHAGTDRAEVVVYGSEREVSVMVIDTGKGFSESETGADRLGLRQSVRRRIEAVDGTVQVWSTPGKGTSVMIRVPAGAA